MKLSITSKLFLAILASCLVVAIAMGAAVRVSFENGFIRYLTHRHDRETERLARSLERAYAAHGGWTFLRDDARAWPALVCDAMDREPPGPVQGRDDGSTDGRFGDRPGGPSPPDWRGPDGPGSPPGGPGPAACGFRRDGGLPPVSLFAADKVRIAGDGPPVAETDLLALHAGGQVIGWLTAGPPRNLFYAADKEFQARQLRATWLIVGAATLVAALVASVLARLFLAPVRRLAGATHRLAAGDYAVRVPEGSTGELSQLAADFNRLATSLESAERARRDFIADISHELRTPLAVLRGEIEALEDGVRTPSPATFASLQAEIAMLNQLINDLHELSLADIGALSFERVPLDLARLVEAAAEPFRERLGAKRLALETAIPETPVTMVGDPHRLTQLMQNLFENALRYTDPGGTVRVAVSAEGDAIHVDVQDSFPSVPEPMLPHLFDRFFRVDPSRSRQSGGSGLGLALCRHIVDAHGGTIRAARSPQGGLWIAVRFPLSEHDA